jgi:hypothetical protein
VKLVKMGYGDWVSSTQLLVAGGTVTFNGALTSLPGTIAVNSTPAGARIYYAVNGGGWIDSGKDTNATLVGLSTGSYQVKLVKMGYGDWVSDPIVVTAGGVMTYHADLIPEGDLNKSQPLYFFPQPATAGQLSLRVMGAGGRFMRIRLFNVLGEMVLDRPLEMDTILENGQEMRECRFGLEDLSSGIYYSVVESMDGSYRKEGKFAVVK